jgi:hypothetical protein
MSGRSLILRDGEWIRGYRKTDRRQSPPTGIACSPTKFRLIFQLPRECWAVSKGPHGWAVDVGDLNNVSVETGYYEITLKKAAEFLHAICKGHDYISVSAVMQYGTRRDNVQLVYTGAKCENVAAFYGSMKPTIFPRKK